MKKIPKQEEGINYWESTADILVALLLVVLLMVMALVLYLAKARKTDFVDNEYGDTYAEYATGTDADKRDNDYDDYYPEEKEEDDDDTSGGGNGGGYTEEEDGLHGEYDDPGDGELTTKSAVYVRVLDGETGNTIKKNGIDFQLYTGGTVLTSLSTYYPKKIEYKKFETTADGVFYLPEKVELDNYSLKNLTAPEGYDIAEPVDFTIDEEYEWNEPYVVTVSMFPQKNKIAINAADVDDNKPLTGATYEVVAKEDIVTLDGTVRYKAGDVVDVITVGSDGKGESKEVFLGEYKLRMKDSPEYYAKDSEEVDATVERKTDSGTVPTQNLTGEKTKYRITVADALYENQTIAGATFSITGGDFSGAESFETDEYGQILLSNLRKNSTYHIRQTGTAENYEIDNEEHTFVVSADGLVDDDVESEMLIKNRTIRVEIAIRDKVLRGQVSDINVNIVDAEGNMVHRFASSGMEEVIPGLKPGTYKVMFRGRENEAHTITVEDRTDVQKFTFRVWTVQGIGALIAAGLIVIAVLVGIIIAIVRKSRNKQK